MFACGGSIGIDNFLRAHCRPAGRRERVCEGRTILIFYRTLILVEIVTRSISKSKFNGMKIRLRISKALRQTAVEKS